MSSDACGGWREEWEGGLGQVPRLMEARRDVLATTPGQHQKYQTHEGSNKTDSVAFHLEITRF